MAASLLDAIQSNSQPQQVGMTDQTGKLASLLRAKSGKAVGGGDTAQSSLGEQQANTQTNQQLGQVSGQAASQNAGIQAQNTAQQSGLQNQKAEIVQTNKFNTQQTQIQTNQLLQQYEQNKGQLSEDQQKAQADQIGFNLRMQNQQYVDNLQRAGDMSRLGDQLQFQTQMAQQTFGDNENLLKQQLGNRSVLDASNQDFERAMGQMTTDQAYDAFHNAMSNEKQRAVYTGIGSVASAGIQAASLAGGGSKTAAPTASGDQSISGPQQPAPMP